jgi:hypothetical protein
MSICVALGIMLGRGIQTLYIEIKKRRETKQQQKREQQQQLSERFHESAHLQPSIQSEYQHLGGHEHPGGEISRHSDHHHHGRNNSVVPTALQTLDWLNTEVVDPLEDTPPMYDHNATRLPPYDHTLLNFTASFPQRGRRRQREDSRRQITEMRIREHADQERTVIWYDALEDRYEVISRSLAPPTESPLPPPYMPNYIEGAFV